MIHSLRLSQTMLRLGKSHRTIGLKMPLLAGIVTKMLTQHMIIELTLSILKWLASRSENTLDDEMVKVVEKELKGA